MKITITNSLCHVSESQSYEEQVIWDSLAYEIPNLRIIQKKTGRHDLPGLKSHYDKRKKFFLLGLLPLVAATLDERGIKYETIKKQENTALPSGEHSLKGIELYDFQEAAVQKFLEQKRGVLKLATGSGKTLAAKAITKALNVPTLFLTHRTNLLYQTAKRFENKLPEYKGKFGIIGDGEHSPNFITFATVQTVARRLKEDPEFARLLTAYQLVIVDEAHKMSSDQFVDAVSACTGAYYRLGLTATPFMRGDKNEDYNLKGSIGDVIYEVTNSDLIVRGLLARPYVKFIEMTSNQPLTHLDNYKDVYLHGIVHNKVRNCKIVESVVKLKTTKPKILVIVYDVSHAKQLTEMIEEAGVRVDLCTGKTDAKTRQKSLDKLEKGKIDCIVASTIFDEGINVESLGSIVLAAGGKSIPSLYQRIGRSMRRKDGEENYCIVIDFIDRQHGILYNQSKQRMNIIKGEKEFKII